MDIRHRALTRKFYASFVVICLISTYFCIVVYEMTDGNGNEINGSRTSRQQNKTKHIAFLKVAKAGSSTIQNILFRFGINHNLNVLMPKPGDYFISRDKHEMMPIKVSEHHDIFAHHAIYEKEFFQSLLPQGAVTIGIVREPIDRIVSSAFYNRDVDKLEYLQHVPRKDFLKHVINEPEIYDPDKFSQTRNEMAKYFGFSKTLTHADKVDIDLYLNQLNSDFLLVLVLEKLDESLVLLKRYLNWSFFDILHMKINANAHEPVSLSEDERNKLKKNAFIDCEIYRYFLNILNAKIEGAGNNFLSEVGYFKHVQDKVELFCSNYTSNNSRLDIPGSHWDDSFSVSNTDCSFMMKKEIPFKEFIRKKQWQIYT